MTARRLPRGSQYHLLVCLLLLAGLCLTGAGVFPASAQQPDSVEVGPEGVPRTDIPVERKSPGRAVFYSAGGSLLLTPLFGPAMGHFYADDNAQAWRGIALRSGGFVLAGAFGLVGVGQASAGAETSGLALADVVLTIVGLQALFDIVTAWHSAKAFNESHDLSARVGPTVGPRGEKMGVSVHVSFSFTDR